MEGACEHLEAVHGDFKDSAFLAYLALVSLSVPAPAAQPCWPAGCCVSRCSSPSAEVPCPASFWSLTASAAACAANGAAGLCAALCLCSTCAGGGLAASSERHRGLLLLGSGGGPARRADSANSLCVAASRSNCQKEAASPPGDACGCRARRHNRCEVQQEPY